MSPTPSHPILLCVSRQMLMQAKSMQSSSGSGGDMQPSQQAIQIARGSAWNAYLLALKDPF